MASQYPSTSIQMTMSKAEKYPAKQHARKVAAQLRAHSGLIYLLGQYDFNMEDSDMPKTWRQRKFFYYCSGVDIPNACVTYDISRDELVLYIEDIKWDTVIWFGRGPTVEEAAETYDVDEVRLTGQLFDDIKSWQKRNSGSFFVLHPEQKPDIEIYNLNDSALLPAIGLCRVFKDEHEIKMIRRANAISAQGHTSVLGQIHNFKNEAQINALFQAVSIINFARQSYGVIAGAGSNAAKLHYMQDQAPLKHKQLVCMDAGSEFENYASDVTRTFPISGRFTKEAQAVYSIVEEMQESAIAALKPGVKMFDLKNLTYKIAIKGLMYLGILHNGSAQEIFDSGCIAAFFPHGLGHHVGLEVHDIDPVPGRQASISSEKAMRVIDLSRDDHPGLEPSMVITIEPGIYFNKQHLEYNWLSNKEKSKYINAKALEQYWAVGGVRIEDNLLITKDGYENLTTAPKGEAMLKIIREARQEAGLEL